METNAHTSPLKDKSLWLAILAPVLVMVGKLVGLDLNSEQILAVVGPIVAFIMSSKLKQAHIVATESKTENIDNLKHGLNNALKALGQPEVK